ncbi:MAG: hypothetical protein ABL897_04335, partial [Hyphomicrobium sp.]
DWIPAKAGIQSSFNRNADRRLGWIPAYAGMTQPWQDMSYLAFRRGWTDVVSHPIDLSNKILAT